MSLNLQLLMFHDDVGIILIKKTCVVSDVSAMLTSSPKLNINDSETSKRVSKNL